MKRSMFLLLIGILVSYPVQAEDAATEPVKLAETAVSEPVPVQIDAPAPTEELLNTDNLEFISGEISESDEVSKTLTVKLYGETDNAPGDKTLKVTVDSNTDITDGEQDRDLKSLTVGTEVDVEYDPATNKATYIFVY